jgi:two-component system NtrC family sensor kinase
MDFSEVDINQLIEETVSFVSHQLHLKQIRLKLSLSEDLPLLSGNGGQLQQVFTNLIINSMHASEPGAAISIESRFSPALGEFSGAIELLFIDHGCGIEEENLNKIFEPFYTTKDIGKGTGLGLSVSYGIIREHGGEIQVTSAFGEGTTFAITLPIMKPARETDNIKETKQP